MKTKQIKLSTRTPRGKYRGIVWVEVCKDDKEYAYWAIKEWKGISWGDDVLRFLGLKDKIWA